MPFEYKNAGLPANEKWELASKMCNRWVDDKMGKMFGPERIKDFMHNQPVAAAKRLLNDAGDASEESVTLALLGPAKGILMAPGEAEVLLRHTFGDRAVDLMHTLADPSKAKDAAMSRDANRIFLIEGISTMEDQLIGRARIDAHHQTRWKILAGLEAGFAKVKGETPGIDKVFADALVKSRDALTKLDQAAAAKQAPKPPGA